MSPKLASFDLFTTSPGQILQLEFLQRLLFYATTWQNFNTKSLFVLILCNHIDFCLLKYALRQAQVTNNLNLHKMQSNSLFQYLLTDNNTIAASVSKLAQK